MTQSRPDGVPEDAWWSESDNEWVLGPKDEQGRLHGPVRYWRPDGTLVSTEISVHGKPHGPATRYHPSGEISQTCTFVDGVLHGTRSWFSIDGPTTETTRAPGMSPLIMRSENDYMHGNVVAVRHYNREGQEVLPSGALVPPRPVGVPLEAAWDPTDGEGLWRRAQARPDQTVVGETTYWRADGTLHTRLEHDDRGRRTILRRFHPDGSLALVADFQAKTGVFHRAEGPTDINVGARPDAAVEVRFTVKVYDETSGRHDFKDRRFFDSAGVELTLAGRPYVQPHPNAEVLSDHSWMEPTTYWRQVEKTPAGDTTMRVWRRDGTPWVVQTQRGQSLTSRTAFDGEGRPLVEETYHPRRGRAAPVLARVVVHLADARFTIDSDATGRCQSVERVAPDGVVVRLPGTVADLSVDDFPRAFAERYGTLADASDVFVWAEGYGGFDFRSIGVERFTDVVPLATLAGDGGGNSAVVVLEGKHAGRVFFNDHEELYCLEDDELREALEDADVSLKASVDERVEALPFFELPFAPSVSEFLALARVTSRVTRWNDLERLRPLDQPYASSTKKPATKQQKPATKQKAATKKPATKRKPATKQQKPAAKAKQKPAAKKTPAKKSTPTKPRAR